jgi:hypothetical protein
VAALDKCNHTELYQLCRRLSLPALPNMPREQLTDLLLGEVQQNIPAHPFDSWRHGLAGFVLSHWQVLQNQVSCPLKSKDPLSCFGCLDTQVVSCVIRNPKNEHLIQLHRK